MSLEVVVQRVSRIPGVPAASLLSRWARAGLGRRRALLTLRVVNALEARALNRDYRGRDYATNVLTFAYGGRPPVADIVLCAQVVAAEARAQGKSAAAHYAHLTVHGVLHAIGMDHDNARTARAMEARERFILSTLGFADPYRTDRAQSVATRHLTRATGPDHGRAPAKPAQA